MHLIQILLPLADNAGKPFADAVLRSIQHDLTERFGGVTAFSRAPAKGIWAKGGDHEQNDIVILEVMTETLEAPGWQTFRQRLEKEL